MKQIGSFLDGKKQKAVYEINPGQYAVEGLDGLFGEADLSVWKSDGKLVLNIESAEDQAELENSAASDLNTLLRYSPIIPIILGIIGFLIFLSVYNNNFFWQPPLNLKVSKENGAKLASKYLSKIQKLPPGYSSVSVFSSDGEALTFLDQKTGPTKTQRLIDKGLPFQSWDTRWFANLKEEEFNVSVDPTNGRLVQYDHTLPDDAPGGRLSQKAALAQAVTYLKKSGYQLAKYRLVSNDSQSLKRRTDWDFEWELRKFDIKGATWRVAVGVYGKSIGSFSEYLHTPEQWSRDFEKNMSTGDLMTTISGIVSAILVFTMLGFFVYFAVRRQRMIWKYSLVASLALIVLAVLSTISGWSDTISSYSTETPYGIFLAETLAVAFAGIVFLYGAQVISFVAANAASERFLGAGKSLIVLNLKSGKRFFSGISRPVLAGYGLAGLMLGYTVLFYLAAGKLVNAWSPASPNYDSLLSARWAWLLPIGAGLTAAFTEETLFRWFSIPLAKRYLKWLPLALFLPASLWAFGHSSYPVFPVYLRGIELTAVGIVMGVFFLRYGIESTMVAHFIFNAFLATLDFLYISAPAYRYQGIALLILMLTLLLWAGTAYALSSRRNLLDQPLIKREIAEETV